MNAHIIWLIDDDEEELTTYSNDFKLDMPQGIQIEGNIPPYPRKIDYVSTLSGKSRYCLYYYRSETKRNENC